MSKEPTHAVDAERGGNDAGVEDDPQNARSREVALRVRRLMQDERYAEAVPELRRIIAGLGSDPTAEGARQIAEFDLGRALYHLKQLDESAAIFRVVGRHRNHIKYAEAQRWLLKLYVAQAAVRPDDFDHLCADWLLNAESESAADPLARPVHYICGRLLLEEEQLEGALKQFELVKREHDEYDAAQECITLIRGRKINVRME